MDRSWPFELIQHGDLSRFAAGYYDRLPHCFVLRGDVIGYLHCLCLSRHSRYQSNLKSQPEPVSALMERRGGTLARKSSSTVAFSIGTSHLPVMS
jgi:hypothetical protein